MHSARVLMALQFALTPQGLGLHGSGGTSEIKYQIL